MDGPLLRALPGYDDPQLIAHGASALVFRATQTTLSRPVAIKVITMDPAGRPGSASRELATTVALSSQPHIVSIIDIGTTEDGHPYIVMEYCEGGSYAQILRRDGPLPVHDVVEVGVGIGEALHAAHQAGIVHRDVKPSNVLRSRFGPALTDFGIARAPDELASTLTREMMTPHHASPEALLHQAQSGSSDLYSLASTMWTLLTGRPPFFDPSQPDQDFYAFRDRVLNEHLPAMPRDDVPAWLTAELGRAMAKLPAARHATAREFVDALRRATLAPPPAVRPPAVGPRHPDPFAAAASPLDPVSRHPAPAAVAATQTADARSSREQHAPPTLLMGQPPPPPAPAAPAAPALPVTLTPPEPESIDEGGWLGPTAAQPTPAEPTSVAAPPTPPAQPTPPAPPAPPAPPELPTALTAPARAPSYGLTVPLLAAAGLLAIAAVAVLMLNANAARPSAAPHTGAPTTRVITPATEGAPIGVHLEADDGVAVTLAWTDPSGGTVDFFVVGVGPGAQRIEPTTPPRGTTRITVTGLDPTKNYCFTVGALYAIDLVAAAPEVCTQR